MFLFYHKGIGSSPVIWHDENRCDLSQVYDSDLINNLKEIRRVLKPNGSVILINAMYRDERFEKRNSYWARLGDFTYHRPKEFEVFLSDAGYSSIQIKVLEKKNWIAALGINR